MDTDTESKKLSIMIKIESLLDNDNATITAHQISRQFHVHISEAIKILTDYTKKNKDLFVNYLINLDDNSSNCIKLRRFLIANGEDDLNFYKSSNPDLTYHVHSIAKQKNAQPELSFNKFLFDPKSLDLAEIQKTTYIQNDHVRFRPIKRKCIMESVQYDQPDSNCANNLIKSEPKSPNKKRQNVENEDSNGLSNGYHKNIKKMKTVADTENLKQEDDDDEDGFIKTEVNMEISPKTEEKDTKEIKKGTNSNNQKNVLKAKTQMSITSFFKKPAK